MILASSSERRLTESEILRAVDARSDLGNRRAVLRLARNEMFARKGRAFKSSTLADYFGRQSWYQPRRADVGLTKVETQNAQTILRLEQQTGGRAAYYYAESPNRRPQSTGQPVSRVTDLAAIPTAQSPAAGASSNTTAPIKDTRLAGGSYDASHASMNPADYSRLNTLDLINRTPTYAPVGMAQANIMPIVNAPYQPAFSPMAPTPMAPAPIAPMPIAPMPYMGPAMMPAGMMAPSMAPNMAPRMYRSASGVRSSAKTLPELPALKTAQVAPSGGISPFVNPQPTPNATVAAPMAQPMAIQPVLPPQTVQPIMPHPIMSQPLMPQPMMPQPAMVPSTISMPAPVMMAPNPAPSPAPSPTMNTGVVYPHQAGAYHAYSGTPAGIQAPWTGNRVGIAGKPGTAPLYRAAAPQNGGTGFFLMPETQSRLVSGAEVLRVAQSFSHLGHPKQVMRLIRAEIFARNGWTFQQGDLAAYFTQQPWYRPANAMFVLTPVEEQNYNMIQALERGF